MIDAAQISLDRLIQSVRRSASNVIDIVRTYSLSINTACVANTIAAAAGRQPGLRQSGSAAVFIHQESYKWSIRNRCCRIERWRISSVWDLVAEEPVHREFKRALG